MLVVCLGAVTALSIRQFYVLGHKNNAVLVFKLNAKRYNQYFKK